MSLLVYLEKGPRRAKLSIRANTESARHLKFSIMSNYKTFFFKTVKDLRFKMMKYPKSVLKML